MSSGVVRLRIWLALLLASTVVLFTAYVFIQQEARLSADDMPLLTIETAKSALALGQKPDQIVPQGYTDVRTSSASFIVITDSKHKILASSIRLDGTTPLPPQGAFDKASSQQQSRFTWEPANGVRLATVVAGYNSTDLGGMYIIAGKPLKYAEMRIQNYTIMFAIAWLVVTIGSSLLIFMPMPEKLTRNIKRPTAVKRKARRKAPVYVPPKVSVQMVSPSDPLKDLLDEPEVELQPLSAASLRIAPHKEPHPEPPVPKKPVSPPPRHYEPEPPATPEPSPTNSDPMAGRYRARGR